MVEEERDDRSLAFIPTATDMSLVSEIGDECRTCIWRTGRKSSQTGYQELAVFSADAHARAAALDRIHTSFKNRRGRRHI
mmetsp:Transcript_31233/g.101856  ORF Transcript_31233/g.101856 Transcript_31233/m.101856 type:complete len:80 (-) Transcript_31233:49-288(-)